MTIRVKNPAITANFSHRRLPPGGGGEPLPAPSFSVNPSFDQPGGYNIGDIITLNFGTAGPSATLTLELFTLNGGSKVLELEGNTWDSAGESSGTMQIQIRATNATGTVLSPIISAALVVPGALSVADQSFSVGTDNVAGEWAHTFTADVGAITSVALFGTNSAHFDATASGGVVSIAPSAAGVAAGLSGPYDFTASFNAEASCNVTIGTFEGRGVMDDAVLAAAVTSSFVHKGQTVTLSGPAPVLWSVDGEPIIVSKDGDVSIASFSTPSASDGTYKRHGAVKDPFLLFNASSLATYPLGTPGQPFDGWANNGVGSFLPSGRWEYYDAGNIDPGNTGVPIVVPQGEGATIVKAVGTTPIFSSTWQVNARYVIVSIVPAWPTTSIWYRPSISTLNKKPRWAITDENPGVHRTLDMPSWVDTPTEAFAESASDWYGFGIEGEAPRRLHTEIPGSSGYSEPIAIRRYQQLMTLHGPGTPAEKAPLARRAAQRGIDIAGVYEQHGYQYEAGAGQFNHFILDVWHAGFYLQDSALLDVARDLFSNELTQADWLDETRVNFPMDWPVDNPRWEGPWVTDLHVGRPLWAKEIVEIIPGRLSGIQANVEHDAAYRGNNNVPKYLALLYLLLLQNSAAGRHGWEEVVDGAGYDTDSLRAADLMYLDEHRKALGLQPYNNTYLEELYDLVRDLNGVPRWTGKNQAISHRYPSEYADIRWATTDGIAWNFAGQSTATEAHVQWDVKLSFDGGFHWIEFEDVGETGSLTGLVAGHEYLWTWREETTPSGKGEWSPPWPFAYDNTVNGKGDTVWNDEAKIPRGLFVPTGTPNAVDAPVNTLQPAILLRPYSLHPVPIYDQAPGSVLGIDAVRIYMGDGAWSVPVTSYTRKWQQSDDGSTGWTDISGATERELYLLGLAGKFLRGEIIATGNGQTSAPAYTNVMQVPAAQSPPAGVLFSSPTFQGRALHTYPQIATMTLVEGGVSTCEHWVDARFPDGVRGAIGVYKRGSRPTCRLELGTAPAGTITYNFEADLAIGLFAEQEQTAAFPNWVLSFETFDRAKKWLTQTVPVLPSGRIITATGSFTVAAGDGDRLIHFLAKNDGGTGNQTGGHVAVTRLHVEPA